MDVRKLAKLIQLMEESSLDEMRIQDENEKVVLRRNVQTQTVVQAAPVQQAAQAPAPQAPAPAPAGKPAAEPEPEAEGEAVTSPLVGTYYEAPSPGAPPYVKVGQRVRTGDNLCIVEAMKVMNNIKAQRDGVILSIEASNSQPVEFGQVLMRIGDG